MADNLSPGLYMLLTVIMGLALVVDFVVVINAATHAMK